MKYFVMVFIAFMMTACGEKSSSSNLVGSYRSTDGKTTFVFNGEGKVSNSAFGKYSETTYVVESGSVRYKFSDGLEMKMKIHNDGSLTSETGTKYLKN